MTLAIHHIAVAAHDPAAISEMLVEGAGFRAIEDGWLAAPNAFVAIEPTARPVGEAEQARQVCDPGITHFCVQSADGRALWARLDATGLDFNAPPVSLGTGALYAYGRDPEFNVIEAEGIGDGDPTAAPWIAHVALATADLERLSAFYGRLVGRAPHDQGTFRNKLFEDITGLPDVEVSAKWIMADNMIFEMWRYLNPPTIAASPPAPGAPGYLRIGFICADLDAEAGRLAAAGIGTGATAAIEGMRARAGADPDGNRFVILEAPPADHRLSLAGLDNPDVVTDRNRKLLTA